MQQSPLELFSPDIEVYSIDEAFLDLSGQPYEAIAQEIRQTVRQWTGIPVSVGVAATKTLAKVANHLAKQQHGVCVLSQPEPVLAQLPVSEVWGIGRRLADRLAGQGVHTALHLRDADLSLIKQQLGIVGVRMVLELRGISCLPLELCPAPRKSCCVSRGFGQPVESLVELQESVASYTARAAAKLRREELVAGMMTVFITTSRFQPVEARYANSETVALTFPTNGTRLLIKAAMAITERLYLSGYSYKKAGVLLLELSPANLMQIDLFGGQISREREHQLMAILDSLNRQFGAGTIRWAAEGLRQGWQMKAERRSPRFTTRWDDLLVVE